ncbi:MAG: hypothetical protein C0459_03365 [Chitinophaga sp.]|nr:hypothetical protein [Chitinophaga sp.]
MRIDPKKVQQIINDAKTIIKYRRRFENVTNVIGNKVPWYFIGIIYMREDGCTFKGHIHNGNSLRKRTYDVPAGRPLKNPASPSGYTFEESAIDLIQLKGWDKVPQWSMPALLYYLEANNGFGYRRLKQSINTPYLWSGTQHYQKGKFDSDGHYNDKLIDAQTGAAPLLKYLTDKTLGLV